MKLLLVFLCCVMVITIPGWASELTPSLTTAQLDYQQCRAFDGNRDLGAVAPQDLDGLLGLAANYQARWEIPATAGKERFFRVAFTEPLTIGTIYSEFAGRQVSRGPFKTDVGALISYLKADVPYPGDVTKDEQWVTIPVGTVVALPAGTRTRALRFSDRYTDAPTNPSRFKAVILLQERYFSALLLGESKRIVTPTKPDIWIGAWNEPTTIAGFIMNSYGAQALQIETLKPEAKEYATIAKNIDWKAGKPTNQPTAWSLYHFETPVSTRGLRLTCSLGSVIKTFLPLLPLGEKGEAPSLLMPPPPFQFPYQMPMDGFVALEISDKKSGKLVRRLIAEVPRAGGQVNESWDLKDDNGNYVMPGEYIWKAIARPPFKNTYEITVNHAGQPAWPAPLPGKGGGYWLGDHSCPIAASAVGDMVFLGCPVAEGGHSIIAVDHAGNKLWGQGAWQLGFFGPTRILADERCAYLVKEGFIQRIDSQNSFKTQDVYKQKPTRELPDWPVGGGAGRDGKLYVSYNAPATSWLQSSFTAAQLDPDRSLPFVSLKKGGGHRGGREDKNYGESEYDELMRYYSTFLTDYMPEVSPSLSGAFIPSSKDSWFGDAPEFGPLGNSLMAAFKEAVTVGSVLVPDARIQVLALKPDAKIPDIVGGVAGKDPDIFGNDVIDIGGDTPFQPEDWIPLEMTGKVGSPGIAIAPEGGIHTRGLLFKTRRLPFALVTSRRFENIIDTAEPVYGEGKGTPRGGWTVARPEGTPITKYDQAMMAYVWPKSVILRGVAILAPTPFSSTNVDYWVGPENVDPKASLQNDSFWKEAGSILPQVFNGYFAQVPSLRSVDFGMLVTTRALRVRALEPEGYRHPPYGNYIVNGQHKAGFDSLIAFRSMGKDAQLPPEMSERITEYQLPDLNDANGKLKVIRHIPLAKPGFMTFDANGVLYAMSNNQVVTVPLNGEASRVVITRDELEKPQEIAEGLQQSYYRWAAIDVDRYAGLAIDKKGLIYIADIKAQVVKVFDGKTGKYLRIIGTPGGPKLGPFDPTKLENPVGITIDSADKLWVAEARWQPKRITRWSLDGKLEEQYMGPTGYGGGGWVDEKDRRILNFDGMKFIIDWEKRTWKLDSIMHCQSLKGSMFAARPDRVVYYQNRRYLLGDPGGNGSYFTTPISGIFIERNGIAVPIAAAGNMGDWGDIDLYDDLKKAFGKLERERYGFIWWDKNEDGIPQLAEVQTSTKYRLLSDGAIRVGNDLSLHFGTMRLLPSGFTPSGIPMYDLAKIEPMPAMENLPPFGGAIWTTEDGRTFTVGNRLIAADGKTIIWEHPDKYPGGAGYYQVGLGMNRPAGFLLGEIKPIGHFYLKNAQGKDEEYFVTNSDQGDWFVYTGDGMLVGCIFGGPEGFGLRYWSMPEWEPGKVDLSDVRLHQEHYQGSIVKAEDGKIYAVAGKDWNSVVRVDGLEKLQRLNGSMTVVKEDIAKAEAWEIERADIEKKRQAPKIAKMPYVPTPITANGLLYEWPSDLFVTIHDYWTHSLIGSEYVIHSQGALAYDDKYLYVAVRTRDDSPMMNNSQDNKLLFKGGDAVDVLLGLDAKADPKRRFPAPGDLRLLISRVEGKPVVMVYRYKVENAPADKRVHFTSPVGEVYIDVVEQALGAEVAVNSERDEKGDSIVVIEAAISWASIGVKPPFIGQHLRGDIGLLQSDPNGVRTMGRLYWSGKTATVVADIPSEAKIVPSTWGEFVTMEPEGDMRFGPDDIDLFP